MAKTWTLAALGLIACLAVAEDQKYETLEAIHASIDSSVVAQACTTETCTVTTLLADSAAMGDATVAGYTTLGGAEGLKVYTYQSGLVAADTTNGYVAITVTNWTNGKVRALLTSGYDYGAGRVYYTTDESDTKFTKAYYDGSTTVYVSFGSNFHDLQDTMNLTIIVAE